MNMHAPLTLTALLEVIASADVAVKELPALHCKLVRALSELPLTITEPLMTSGEEKPTGGAQTTEAPLPLPRVRTALLVKRPVVTDAELDEAITTEVAKPPSLTVPNVMEPVLVSSVSVPALTNVTLLSETKPILRLNIKQP